MDKLPEFEKPVRRRGNVRDKRIALSADVQLFAKKYDRKAQKGVEPNDRKYDKKILEKVKHLDPVELDLLLRGEE